MQRAQVGGRGPCRGARGGRIAARTHRRRSGGRQAGECGRVAAGLVGRDERRLVTCLARHHRHLAGQVGELLAVHPVVLVEHHAAPVAQTQRPREEGVAREAAVEPDEEELGDLALARQPRRHAQQRRPQRTGPMAAAAGLGAAG